MDICDFKDIHKGGRVFITASGPSLLEFKPDLLKDEYIIAVNETIQRFPWAHYACAMDIGPYEICVKSDAIIFTTQKSGYPDVKLSIWNKAPFSFELSDGINPGGTTTMLALQVAVYMGFQEIYLCGLDLGVTNDKTHFFGTRDNFNDVTGCNFPIMRKCFEASAPSLLDKKIINCSEKSTLDCFPKQSIYTILKQTKPKEIPPDLYKIIERPTTVEQLTLEKNVVLIGSKYVIQLPNGTFLVAKYTMREYAKPALDAINEKLRRKGGRPRKVQVK